MREKYTSPTMNSKIKVIAIDGDYLSHDYGEVRSPKYTEHAETSFSFRIMESDNDILAKISEDRDADVLITVGGNADDYTEMLLLPFLYRRKWVHMEEFNPQEMARLIISVFSNNLWRSGKNRLFSVFTCTFNTGRKKLERLYGSLRSQIYKEWNWWVLDDSTDDETVRILSSFNDPRIRIFRNVSDKGSIGFNKHMIAMMCDGDYLVEADHDDALTPDCLLMLKRVFDEYPRTDFAYSLCLEYSVSGDGKKTPIIYGDGWGWGEGVTKTEYIDGKKQTFSATPDITPFSIRTIYAQPNHVRCWRRDFYHRIGGHCQDLAVLDDMDMIIRTFLHGNITKIDKALYIQYEEGERGKSSGNTQSSRFAEIQRTVWILKSKYDKAIHDRILSMGKEDTAWDSDKNMSILSKPHEKGSMIMNEVYPPSINT